jgi:hypothetical protein
VVVMAGKGKVHKQMTGGMKPKMEVSVSVVKPTPRKSKKY